MNGTDSLEKTTLEDLSHEKCLELIPMHLYVIMLTIVGLFGNTLVCHFYITRGPDSPTTRLILTVAFIDTLVCLFMPKNIAIMCRSYRGYGAIPCKLNYFSNHIAGMSSTLVLVAIAIFRHRAVCRPLAVQFTLWHTNIAVLLSIAFSVIMALPTLFEAELTPIVVRVDTNASITGYNCQFSEDPSKKALVMASGGVFSTLFILLLVTLVVLYSLIGMNILKRTKRRKSLAAKPVQETWKGTLSETSGDISGTDDECSDAESVHERVEAGSLENSLEGGQILGDISTEIANGNAWTKMLNGNVECCNTKPIKSNADIADQSARHAHSSGGYASNIPHAAVRQLLMLFVITVIYVLSFLPYLVTVIVVAISKDNEDHGYIYTNWYQLCYRSYLINSAANPFVYGFFNTDFRHYVKDLFCRWNLCFRKENENLSK